MLNSKGSLATFSGIRPSVQPLPNLSIDRPRLGYMVHSRPHMYNNEKCSARKMKSVSRIKKQDFGLQSWLLLELMSTLAARENFSGIFGFARETDSNFFEIFSFVCCPSDSERAYGKTMTNFALKRRYKKRYLMVCLICETIAESMLFTLLDW